MRLIVTILGVLSFQLVFAQQQIAEELLQKQATARFASQAETLTDKVLDAENPDPLNTNLVLVSKTSSKIGNHYFYQQYHLGVPVYGAFLKVNTNHKGQLLNTFNTLINTNNFNVPTKQALEKSYWVVNGDALLQTVAQTADGMFTLNTVSGQTVFSRDNKLYFTDTTIKARVFNPDPLTTAGVDYGKNGTYRHFNDSDYALINNERKLVTMPARYDNGKFVLQNKFARIEDFSGPSIAPATSTTDSFMFTRKQSGFKDVMALYHIYATQLYMQTLGYNNLANFQIKVDAHALTADQSFFTFTPDTTLSFGTGGVPDAEDADVIVHEYTHAMIFSLNADGIVANERRALEEGICDAFCCAYSKRINPFNWKRIFSWDGYNEFWNGRNGASNKTYTDRIGDYYSDSEIWSSAMNNISEALGEDKCLKLLLAIIPQLSPSTTLPQAARLMYDADSILNDSKNRWYLAQEFNARKFGSFPTGVNDVVQQSLFNLSNTTAFAQGTGSAVLQFKQVGEMQVTAINMQGEVVKTWVVKENLTLNPDDFSAGVYFIRVNDKSTTSAIKLIKY